MVVAHYTSSYTIANQRFGDKMGLINTFQHSPMATSEKKKEKCDEQ
jgi:hypothetical protein